MNRIRWRSYDGRVLFMRISVFTLMKMFIFVEVRLRKKKGKEKIDCGKQGTPE